MKFFMDIRQAMITVSGSPARKEKSQSQHEFLAAEIFMPDPAYDLLTINE